MSDIDRILEEDADHGDWYGAAVTELMDRPGRRPRDIHVAVESRSAACPQPVVMRAVREAIRVLGVADSSPECAGDPVVLVFRVQQGDDEVEEGLVGVIWEAGEVLKREGAWPEGYALALLLCPGAARHGPHWIIRMENAEQLEARAVAQEGA